jgi:RNA processing factor Prp31
MYSSDIKKAARQIVRESLDQILAGTYQIPSLEEMVSILESNFDHSFDEYKATQRIKRSHLDWSEMQVSDELDRQKRHYENELRVNLKVAALNTIEEIENLINSLNHTIVEWKIVNL